MDSEPKRKASISNSSDSHVPSLAPPHRRMSRVIDPSRKMSMYNMRRPSLAGSQRTGDYVVPKMPVRLANTYRLEPKNGEKFSSGEVSRVIAEVLENYLSGETYEETMCGKLAKNIAEILKERVKSMKFPRYKFVSEVTITQNGRQSMQTASRCLSNQQTDSYATASYKNSSLSAYAAVYGFYFE
ncbi:unnamed protein product [Dimorphilus gyrociliatus]|uniref:Uncharacterized protein n=1 Tax=Dimorphilus gyrociliatus TaxID=2664684 RepID=A0A7I8W2R0_9ANNE|nr:unnamed protein product [Dimorphilus gyrociliatus]